MALRLPVVLGPGAPEGRTPAEAAAGGAGAGPAEVLAALAALLPGAEPVPRPSGLPLVRLRGALTGPGVPVLAGTSPADGPDGPYRADGDGVARERGGAWFPHDAGVDVEAPGLLLFTPEARWRLGGGRAVVEDPFCQVEAPLPPGRAEALLVRRLRFDPAILRWAGAGAGPVASWLEVCRRTDLLEGAPWDDPARLLGVREGVERAAFAGGRLTLSLVTGARPVFEFESGPAGGWTLRLVAGDFPASAVRLAVDGPVLRYAWRLDGGLDPLDPGVRARLAFDLLSDLVRLA